jgi:sortase (surface protein transpeptidase)
VLSGHIKGTSGGVFRGLSDVVVGDEVWLYTTDGRTLHYVVDEALLLRETGEDLAQRAANARYMDPTDDTRLTLITCWPDWAYTHRVVVIARPVVGQ